MSSFSIRKTCDESWSWNWNQELWYREKSLLADQLFPKQYGLTFFLFLFFRTTIAWYVCVKSNIYTNQNSSAQAQISHTYAELWIVAIFVEET